MGTMVVAEIVMGELGLGRKKWPPEHPQDKPGEPSAGSAPVVIPPISLSDRFEKRGRTVVEYSTIEAIVVLPRSLPCSGAAKVI